MTVKLGGAAAGAAMLSLEVVGAAITSLCLFVDGREIGALVAKAGPRSG